MARWSPLLAHRARGTHQVVIEAGGARYMRTVGDQSGHSNKQHSLGNSGVQVFGDQAEFAVDSTKVEIAGDGEEAA